MQNSIAVLVGLQLLAALTLLPQAVTQAVSSPDFGVMVVGIASDGEIIAAGVPLSSGPWGTDYITVSHALGVRSKYGLARDGYARTDAKPVAACSAQFHSIDVLILRVSEHTNTSVVDWGDPTLLKLGDELLISPRREFHPNPIAVRFVSLDLREWTKSQPGVWSAEFRHVMVGDGFSKPGFSGSPWARDGKVYGLHKGSVRPEGQAKWFAVAETATNVSQCLKLIRYEELIPRQ